MSNQQEQMTETNKPKIMTGFIHYNDVDDLTSLFEVLNGFRKNYNLKYSHQGIVKLVFFNISSEYLGELAKVRPFKISRFQTKTEYQCDKEDAEKLMSLKDSFVRMMWDENSNTLTFMSRTVSRVHGNLVRRIFRDAEVSFNKEGYKVLREETTDGEYAIDNIQPEESKPRTKKFNGKQFNGKQFNNNQVEEDQVPDGFQRATNKKPRNTSNFVNKTKNSNTLETNVSRTNETSAKPKPRGSKTKTNV